MAMTEFLRGVFSLTYWDAVVDIHGLLAMSLLILFGAALMLYASLDKFVQAARWMKYTLSALVVNLIAVDIVGIYAYGAYRASEGPRTLLKASPDTAWLHEILFEHKEMLAYAPWLMILVALVIVAVLGEQLKSREFRALRFIVLFSIVVSLAFVLVVAGEAVLITKVAPLR